MVLHKVYVVDSDDMPSREPMAAVLRFSEPKEFS